MRNGISIHSVYMYIFLFQVDMISSFTSLPSFYETAGF